MGSLLGLPGTVAGAIIGGGIGLITGASQIYEERDEAFKAYVQEATQGQMEDLSSSITSGSATAAQRELDLIAFDQLLGGKGAKYLADLREMAADTPMEYEDLTAMSRALATGFGKDQQRMLDLMEGIGNAGSAVGVDASGMTYMAQVMSRMQSSGKVSLEDLNAFQDRGINVIEMLSKSLGKSQGDIYDMISKGGISGTQAVDIIQQGLEQYDGAMDKMSQTYSGLTSTLTDAQTEMDNAYGEGYNETRKQGLQEEIDYLSGYSGDLMKEANRAMGAWQAELENSKEQYQREALSAVMAGAKATSFSDKNQDRLNEMWSEYQLAESKGDAAEQGRLLAEARVMAQGEYNASEGAQLMLQYETELAEAIRDDAASNDAYWDAGYQKGQEFNKGLMAARSNFKIPTGPGVDENGVLLNWTDDGGNVHTSEGGDGWYDDGGNFHPYAFGLDRVPYDDYPALLHEGERVLTAQEARAQDNARQRGDGTALVPGDRSPVGVDRPAPERAFAVGLDRVLAAREAPAQDRSEAMGLLEPAAPMILDRGPDSSRTIAPLAAEMAGAEPAVTPERTWAADIAALLRGVDADLLAGARASAGRQTAPSEMVRQGADPSRVYNFNFSGSTFGDGLSAEEIAQRLADAIELKFAAGVLS